MSSFAFQAIKSFETVEQSSIFFLFDLAFFAVKNDGKFAENQLFFFQFILEKF